MQDFTGKLAVITGGASGVGRSLAFALGAEGARVLIADVDERGLENTKADLVDKGVDAHSQRCDVSRQQSLDALAATAFDDLGGAHLVFANAGISAGEAGNLWEYSSQDWQWTFNVNFWGVIHSINAFMPRLVAQGEEAHLAITGSGNGAFIVYPDQPVYTATKAAIQAVTEALHIQTRNQDSPVKIHALFPGPHIVDTGIFNSDRVRPSEFEKPEGSPETGINSAEDLRKLMEFMGQKLVTTHPDEVAQTAIRGIRDGQFWIAPLNPGIKDMVRARFDSILERSELPIPTLG
ncbi:MAG: SDR family NAD(P)-dependent oxidoreductase [Gammaproteobacteria bacterium]|nr:SDR family NAD(P)-dependent oxidoreductase [Gammaproteobacteria bacterium]MDE0366890.1 SDR family NAD(P)-dependent oxidoreductase [Gammaproteobacteria bacterium]